MNRKLFVNVAVQDLQKSQEFFTELGFRFDPRFTDTNAACMIINEDSAIMLLTRSFFRRFTRKDPVDTTRHTEAIIAISAERREEVDELVNRPLRLAHARPSTRSSRKGCIPGVFKTSTATCGKWCGWTPGGRRQ